MTMKFYFSALITSILVLTAAITGCTETDGRQAAEIAEADYSVLVFSKTTGWRHDSIEAGIEAIRKLGQENGFEVTATEDAGHFTAGQLSAYDAVIFLNTTETIFEDPQREAFKTYIQNGGGYVGVHSAADTEYEWDWYGRLAGAWFESHPEIAEAELRVVDAGHRTTEFLPDPWTRTDEWYNFGYMNEEVNVLLKLDTESYEGSEHPGDHPIAWYHEFDGGRAFYTGLGHTIESYSEPLFLRHLLEGIQYAAGTDN